MTYTLLKKITLVSLIGLITSPNTVDARGAKTTTISRPILTRAATTTINITPSTTINTESEEEEEEETKTLSECFKSYKNCMDNRAISVLSKYSDFLEVSQDMILNYYTENNSPQFRCIFNKNARGYYLKNYFATSSVNQSMPTEPAKGSVNYYQSLMAQLNAFNTGRIGVENLHNQIFRDAGVSRPKDANPLDLSSIQLRISELDSEFEYNLADTFCTSEDNESSPFETACSDYIYSAQEIYMSTEDNEYTLSELDENDLDFISVEQSCKDFAVYAGTKLTNIKIQYDKEVKANKSLIKDKIKMYETSLD